MRLACLLFLMLVPTSLLAIVEPEILGPYVGVTVVEVTFSGNKRTKDFVVERELELEVGKPLTLTAVKDDFRRLDNLGIFSSVDVAAEERDGGVAIEYQLRELPGVIPYVTVSYSEQDGWGVGPALTAKNLFGQNITVSGYVLFGGQELFSLRYADPWIAGNRLSFDVLAEHIVRDNEFEGFRETDDEIRLSIGSHVGRNGRAEMIGSYFTVESDEDGHTLSPDNRDQMHRLGFAMGYDSRDVYRNPHEGWRVQLEFLKTGGSLGGDGNFLSTTVDLRRFQPVFGDQTLALGAFTVLQSGTLGVDIPEYLQFYMGGANSIRGYDLDVLGYELQGTSQLIFTAEHRIDIMKIREIKVFGVGLGVGVQLALVADAGIAWNEPEEFTKDNAKSGIGAGFRLLVPWVDMLRFDFGYPLSEGDEAQISVKFHFGANSKFNAQRRRRR